MSAWAGWSWLRVALTTACSSLRRSQVIPWRNTSWAIRRRRPHAARPQCSWLVGGSALFQSLSPLRGATDRIGFGSQTDLVEYCDIRLRALQDLGCDWATQAMRKRVEKTLSALCAASGNDDSRLVWSHGDYAPHNMIWDGSTLTPIDFAMANLDKPLKDGDVLHSSLGDDAGVLPMATLAYLRMDTSVLDGIRASGCGDFCHVPSFSHSTPVVSTADLQHPGAEECKAESP